MTLKNTKQQLLMQMMTRVDTIAAMITQANGWQRHLARECML